MGDLNDLGLHNPRRNFLICIGVTLVAWAFVAWGTYEMREAGPEALGPALKVGLALLPAILGPVAAWNFWRGIKVFAAIRRGENELGRWTVTAADLAEFSVIDDARNAHGGMYLNVWTRPRELPAAGLEIIFVADGVLVGDAYYALVTTGIFKFTAVGMLIEGPPTIEFVTVMTSARGGSAWSVRTSAGALRLPVSRLAGAEAARVLDHYRRVLARDIVVNPNYYRRVMWIALIGAPIFFAVAAFGYWLDGDDLPDIMLALGILLGGAMLILASVARLMSRAQLRKP